MALKKVLLAPTFILCFLLMSYRIQAQSQNVFKVNVISPFLLTGNAAYERVLTERSSFQLGALTSGLRLGSIRYRGYGFTPEYRFYVLEAQEAPNGFYVAPFLRYRKFNINNVNDTRLGGSLRTIGGGVTAGYQAIFNERFSVDAFLGPSFSSATIRSADGYTPSLPFGLFAGLGLRAGLTVGIAF
ncbi:DUF3575 domain-containing protein [Tellurirhabdus bombi]|uniref:DUF3575 domain-containing protein n=1 Tax=Tellurirhabdus bombi TaxID=2907205 RepID=UPI0021034175|nr:DUF3575 domain-containing protein [Tellurirhabdus bombi]